MGFNMSHNRQSSAPLPPKKTKLTSSLSHESLNHPVSCPICQEEMISIAQLNQHLDDLHMEEKQPKEFIRDWFMKPTRPLKNINEKEKAQSFLGIKERVLKRSESNYDSTSNLNSGSSSSIGFMSLLTSNAPKNGEKEQTGCTKCSKTLGLLYGKVNCLL